MIEIELTKFWCTTCGENEKPRKQIAFGMSNRTMVSLCERCMCELIEKARAALDDTTTEPTGAERVREPIAWFAQQMEAKLRENDHKGGWENCDIVYLYRRLCEEVDELSRCTRDDTDGLIREAADVANFAMMIADNARRLSSINTPEGEENDA